LDEVFVFDWKSIGLGAFAGGFAYLVKTFTAAPVQTVNRTKRTQSVSKED
jgi:hypothetical protein